MDGNFNQKSDFNVDVKKLLAGDYRYLTDTGKRIGKNLLKIKRSQFRRVFSHIRKILSKIESAKIKENNNIPEQIYKDILLIKPKMAYTAGRHPKLRPFFENTLVPIIDAIKTMKDFIIFYDLIESILAYRRFYGGKE